MNTPAPGWYPDPSAGWQYRYWDGGVWTQHTAPMAQSVGTSAGRAVPPLPFGGVRADFGRRLIGYLIDGLIIAIPAFVVIGFAIAAFVASVPQSDTETANPDFRPFLLLFAAYGFVFVLHWAYLAYFMTGGRRTVGQRAAHLRLVDARTGQPLTVGKVLLRALVAAFASSQLVGLGYWWALIDAEGRTWHDMAAGSVVLDER